MNNMSKAVERLGSEDALAALIYDHDPMCGHADCEVTARGLWPYIEPLLAAATRTADLQQEVVRLKEALRPFGDLIAGVERTTPRYFIQLLICPDGDNGPGNWRVKFETAAALSTQAKDQRND